MEPFYVRSSKYIGVHLSFLILDQICHCTVDDFVHHLSVLVVTERCASLIVLPCNSYNGMVEYSQEEQFVVS